jgi:four helix bundle protein
MKDFRQLAVWQKSHELTVLLYEVTSSFPREEVYGLTAQIRRAASSIPANIAEGCGTDGDMELARYCRIARASASELEYHVLLARDLRLLSAEVCLQIGERVVEVKRMLTGLIQKMAADRKLTADG